MQVDLNADMGESFGLWTMGNDAALLRTVTSANIACGAHAGDPDVMAKTMNIALDQAVGIGSHPGFADLEGFGRRRIAMPLTSLQNSICIQVGATLGMAKAIGATVRHAKLHGALGNMTSEDEGMARGCYEAVLSVHPDAILLVLATTAQETAARSLGARFACEIFADRAYNDDATLVDRNLPGAVIHSPSEAGLRVVEMVKSQAIITASGKLIKTPIDSICCHGDTPKAVDIAASVRLALEDNNILVTAFSGRTS
ncbi:MAG TPA: LamB/YcsF family protein [Rhodobacteraceae bacterium]|nr:LamB/YcsF family protein [Alphaproteobacteria bacterium]MCH9831867.1 LamB/YcsF family protein [Alphaproteobacteria bacterium]HAB38539.1 LamB/YcsF family protein [Paracoccaceae bacterium]